MAIDWAKKRNFEHNTCTCKCFASFRSRTAIDYDEKKLVSEDPCPECGSHRIISARSDPEEMTVSSEDKGKINNG